MVIAPPTLPGQVLTRHLRQKGWDRIDWTELVCKQRFVKTLAVRQGEAETLLPQVDAWLESGAV